MPKRIQMSMRIPWRAKHPTAVVIARPHTFGNPYRAARSGTGCKVTNPHQPDFYHWHATKARAIECVIAQYRAAILTGQPWAPTVEQIRAELAGRDLACWCKTTSPCHGDVLLEIANDGGTHADT